MSFLVRVFAALLLAFSFNSAGGQMSLDQQQAIVLKRMIERNHFMARPVDDSFSSKLFDKIIEELGQPEFIFTASEYERLTQCRYKLDDELKGSAWKFLDLLTSSYASGAKRADSLVTNFLQKPLDLSAEDKVTLIRHQSQSFPPTAIEMKQIWNKKLKWHLLNAAYDLSLSQTPKPSIKEVLAKNEPALRQKVKRTAFAGIPDFRDLKSLSQNLKEWYLNAVAIVFDPHTEFFSPEEKQNFQASLSTEDKSFGFITGEKEGKVIIQHLIPGGPAWKSGELHVNDQLLQFTLDGKEPVDLAMISSEEAEETIEGTPASNISLKIKKTDGSLKTVALRKEIIETEDNVVKGYVLRGSKKFGYISLPDFYTSWDEESGSSCAEDVAKEIVNLKKEGIEGLILDVRFNGGGSMQEALQLIGIFINEGPLLGVKDKNGKVGFLKDPNRGTIYDGPMVVLINGHSASASEALAACLQDYNRAIIVGSPSYGKGTIQQFFPMDTTAGSRTANAPLGFVKITTGKFYRLGGGTAQWNGVVPDVYLPDAFEVLENREKFELNSLPADSIKGNNYYKALAALPAKELAQISKQRLSANPGFAEVKKSIEQYKKILNNKQHTIPLKPEGFDRWRKEYDLINSEEEEKTEATSTLFNVANHAYELQRLANNAYAGEVNSVIIKNLQQDIYIEEAFQILSDLIQKTTPK